MRIWWKQQENMDTKGIVKILRASRGILMVWGMFSRHAWSNLIHVHEHLSKASYLNIVAD